MPANGRYTPLRSVPLVLIQMLLPARSAERVAFPDELLRTTRKELVDRFGGLTAYTRSPAAGVWTSPEGHIEEDSVVMVEVLAPHFDAWWWRTYAQTLKKRFQQETIHIRATEVQVLDN
jgi:hypothetical protein